MASFVPPGDQSHLGPGFRLGRYELLCPIGTGGMATVWVARLLAMHGFEKFVAIKLILPRYAGDPLFEQMFLDEARIASKIHHPNVAEVLDLGDQHGLLYLVMEWVEGDALSKLAKVVRDRGEEFSLGIAMRIAADVCAGLHAAHELRDRGGVPLDIVHRDVSPQNVLVNERGVAKVIDFGIAKASARASGDTSTGSVKGKAKYMAPEQAITPRLTDRRADVWAVGSILYTLASGRSPFEADNEVATLTMLASGRPPLELPDRISGTVRAVVRRALEFDPNKRYQTADELRQALEDAMAKDGLPATSADVAAFCAEYLADRAEARRTSIVLALNEAEERSRLGAPSTRQTSGTRASLASGPRLSVPTRPDVPAPRPAPGETPAAVATTTSSPPSPRIGHLGTIAASIVITSLGILAFIAATRRPGVLSGRASAPAPSVVQEASAAEASAVNGVAPLPPSESDAKPPAVATPGHASTASSTQRRRLPPARPPAPSLIPSATTPAGTRFKGNYGF